MIITGAGAGAGLGAGAGAGAGAGDGGEAAQPPKINPLTNTITSGIKRNFFITHPRCTIYSLYYNGGGVKRLGY